MIHMKILFWNTHNNQDINTTLSELILENRASIVVLAEYAADMDTLISLLSSHGLNMKQYINCCDRIKMMGCVDDVEPKMDTQHTTIQVINKDYILCGVHLNSQMYSGNMGYREILIAQLIQDIQNVEKELKTENTMIVGDFNINPYDTSCIDARFFHGIPIFEETKRKERTIAGKSFKMFYNPMWNFLGDFNEPYGTYYYNGNDSNSTYWNIYDQVIIRPMLKEKFVNESLKILTETETRYLLDKNGHPDKNISDHLPIIFEIKEENYG